MEAEPVICRCCFENIAPSEENPSLVCPKCGTVNKTVESPAPPIAPPVVPVGTLNLRRCPDCGKEVSVHAESCPHCGAPVLKQKRRGVFFFVFWGVVSLIVTCLLIASGMGLLSGIFAYMHQSVKASKESSSYVTPKEISLT